MTNRMASQNVLFFCIFFTSLAAGGADQHSSVSCDENKIRTIPRDQLGELYCLPREFKDSLTGSVKRVNIPIRALTAPEAWATQCPIRIEPSANHVSGCVYKPHFGKQDAISIRRWGGRFDVTGNDVIGRQWLKSIFEPERQNRDLVYLHQNVGNSRYYFYILDLPTAGDLPKILIVEAFDMLDDATSCVSEMPEEAMTTSENGICPDSVFDTAPSDIDFSQIRTSAERARVMDVVLRATQTDTGGGYEAPP